MKTWPTYSWWKVGKRCTSWYRRYYLILPNYCNVNVQAMTPKCTVIESETVFNYIQPFPKPVFDPYWVDYYILDKFGAGKEVDLVIVSAKFCLNLNCCWNWLSRGFKLNSRMLIQMLLRKSGVEPYLLINRNLFLFSPFRIQIWLCVIFLYDP